MDRLLEDYVLYTAHIDDWLMMNAVVQNNHELRQKAWRLLMSTPEDQQRSLMELHRACGGLYEAECSQLKEYARGRLDPATAEWRDVHRVLRFRLDLRQQIELWQKAGGLDETAMWETAFFGQLLDEADQRRFEQQRCDERQGRRQGIICEENIPIWQAARENLYRRCSHEIRQWIRGSTDRDSTSSRGNAGTL